jgi:hypothetical protein
MGPGLHALRAAALVVGCCAGASALAGETPPQLWLDSGFLSHHVQHRGRYNEHNDGLGLEWHFGSGDWQLDAGHYRNSLRQGSNYLQLGWTPLKAELPWRMQARLGASVGAVDGYPSVRHGGWFPTLVPVLSLEGSRVGVNLVYIPTVGKRVDGAYAVQLKFRAF